VDYRKGLWNQTDPDAGDNYTLPNITIQWSVVWLSSPVCGNIDIYEHPDMEWKLVIASFAHTRYSICLPTILTICLCSMYFVLSTRAIAFVVDFSIQYEVYL
jgi:hypothetical protein